MAFDLTSISNFINSPPGQLAAGAVLAGIVWKFFEKVESILKDDTKKEIGEWLLGARFGHTVEQWPETFAKVFDRVFGYKHLSLKCFARSSLASLGVMLAYLILAGRFVPFPVKAVLHTPHPSGASIVALTILVGDYVALLGTRYALELMMNSGKVKIATVVICHLVAVFLWTSLIMLISGFMIWALAKYGSDLLWPDVWSAFKQRFEIVLSQPMYSLRPLPITGPSELGGEFVNLNGAIYVSSLLTSIWLWIYLSGGVLIKAGRRFDNISEFFKATADIEHKPLSTIGLVAGALVAILWWTAVIVKWIV